MSTSLEQVQLQLRNCPKKFRASFISALNTNQLIFAASNIDDIELKHYILPFLKENHSIKYLDISYNVKISDESLKMLSEVKTIDSLNVGYTAIGSLGIKYITKTKTLTLLNIEFGLNQVDPIGDEIALELSSNKTLRHLNISGNQLTDEGIMALAKNQGLNTLIICANQNPLGGKCLDAFRTNQTLRSLDLSANETLKGVSKSLSLDINHFRKMMHEQAKTAFLSVITLTDSKTGQHHDDTKKASLFFKYYSGVKRSGLNENFNQNIVNNRLTNDLLRNILSYLKPRPCDLIAMQV